MEIVKKEIINKDRVELIDIAKGIGIILVVLGHSSMGYSAPIIYGFHMPLFFMLSGMTFNVDKYSTIIQLLKNRIYTLGIPYLLFALLKWLRRTLLVATGMGEYKLLKSFLGIFVGCIRDSDYDIGMWYVPCLLSVQMLVVILFKYVKKFSHRIFAVVCFYILGMILCTYIHVKLPYNVDTACIAVVFFAIGCLYKEVLLKINKKLIWICGILYIIFGGINSHGWSITIDMRKDIYGNLFLFFVAALCGCIVVIGVSRNIHNSIIATIGKNSLYYYGMHGLILFPISLLCRKILEYTQLKDNIVAEEIGETIYCILVVGICWILYPLYNKILNIIMEKLRIEKI